MINTVVLSRNQSLSVDQVLLMMHTFDPALLVFNLSNIWCWTSALT